MKSIIVAAYSAIIVAAGCTDQAAERGSIIAAGQMPNLTKDKKNNLHLVYGNGDSIMYSLSTNGGKTFSPPELVAALPGLAASHMRGPQIAATSEGLSAIASNSSGDIFSFVMDEKGKWSEMARVNDADTVAKEGLMALSADGPNAFAVWLDLRGNGHNKIFGARSNDGGKTWSKNFLIYSSPDSSVCECCKPSILINGDHVYVMFRNWLNGNRDLYLIHSSNGGNSFEEAQKLGEGSWQLDGCPMDGGAFALTKSGRAETVWKRRDNIYACEPGKPEVRIGEGRNCTMEIVNGKNVYAWTENGMVVLLRPAGTKQKLGTGSLPILKSLDNAHVICVWENEKQIYSSIVEL
jgi:Neuraminidase (sialidase)